MSILSQRHFHDEAAAFAYVEAIIWNGTPVCPHCGGYERIYDLSKTRIGLRKCGQCRKQFTVRVGTIFEDSHLPMTKWLQAIHLMCCSKKGVSSHQLMRILQTTYRTAWHLSHRIREAMRSGDLAPFGSDGGDVEVDETYIGRDPDEPKAKAGWGQKMKVLSLVERNTGRARSIVMDSVTSKTVTEVVSANLSKEARLLTDQATYYKRVGKTMRDHKSVNHSIEEWVSDVDRTVHTNTIEGYFSIFKRGMKGTYQHCGKQHLHRYMAEFDFRYSNRVALGVDDTCRSERALKGFVGKRLTYRGSPRAA